jgi:hypothetical protein
MRGRGDEGVSELMTMMCNEKWHNSEEKKDENARQSDKDRKDAIRVVYYKMITAWAWHPHRLHRAVIGFALPRMDACAAVDVLNPSSRMTASKSAF